MLEIDFLSGSKSDPDSTKSYDAIVARFKEDQDSKEKIIVIDAGFSEVGDDVTNFLAERYGTDEVDAMISTHPDTDHLNGLVTAMQQLKVKELLIHQPGQYRSNLDGFGNLDNLNDLLGYAEAQGTKISDPYTGLSLFDGRLLILGPTEDYYKKLLADQFDPEVMASLSQYNQPGTSLLAKAMSTLGKIIDKLPIETLGDDGKTSPRNNSSVIALLTVDGKRHMLTGDAGIEALGYAADYYEQQHGSFKDAPLCSFQMPHHGSKHNAGKSILNRIIGNHNEPHNADMRVHISAVKASKKHPHPKVTNAAMRRGVEDHHIAVTNGSSFCHSHNAPDRGDYSPISPYPILEEE